MEAQSSRGFGLRQAPPPPKLPTCSVKNASGKINNWKPIVVHILSIEGGGRSGGGGWWRGGVCEGLGQGTDLTLPCRPNVTTDKNVQLYITYEYVLCKLLILPKYSSKNVPLILVSCFAKLWKFRPNFYFVFREISRNLRKILQNMKLKIREFVNNTLGCISQNDPDALQDHCVLM